MGMSKAENRKRRRADERRDDHLRRLGGWLPRGERAHARPGYIFAIAAHACRLFFPIAFVTLFIYVGEKISAERERSTRPRFTITDSSDMVYLRELGTDVLSWAASAVTGYDYGMVHGNLSSLLSGLKERMAEARRRQLALQQPPSPVVPIVDKQPPPVVGPQYDVRRHPHHRRHPEDPRGGAQEGQRDALVPRSPALRELAGSFSEFWLSLARFGIGYTEPA
jgi:hypothetical protein